MTLEEYLTKFAEKYKPIYGENFTIKPEGVIDNIAVAQSLVALDFEDRILQVKKSLNPYEAGGVEQDRLYANVKLFRRQATYTIVQRQIEGTPNTIVADGSLLIEDESTQNQFKLSGDVELDNSGIGTGSFKSELIGDIDLSIEATLLIKTPLPNVIGVYYVDGNDINKGITYESNAEFRKRWLNWSQSGDKMKAALLDFVDNSGDIIVRQNRGTLKHSDIGLHTMSIHINSAVDDLTIATRIFEKLADGLELSGDISENIIDDSGQNEVIKFSRSQPAKIYVKSIVKKNESFADAQARSETLNAITDYYTNTNFVMGGVIVANRFDSGIDNQQSIDYVVKTQVSTNGTFWQDVVEIGQFEMPIFDIDRVTIEVQ